MKAELQNLMLAFFGNTLSDFRQKHHWLKYLRIPRCARLELLIAMFRKNKINIYTEMSHTASKKVKQVLDSSDSPLHYPSTLLQAREAVKEAVREKLRVFGSAGKA